MNEMIVRVARAMFDSSELAPVWKGWTDYPFKDIYYAYSKAAYAAIANPNDEDTRIANTNVAVKD
jgi:hypothetical protein